MRRFKGYKLQMKVVQGCAYATWVSYETPTGARSFANNIEDVCAIVGISVDDIEYLDEIA